ncbi:MAG TPA: ATPase domain-containing protein, partial [Thermodesulfobacteriota bacterium]|nr:ATPase domain-containing protein [Thermodesulfobacteriota bacterium]
MAKVKSIFSCQACGYQSPKWLGRCPECGGWNTLVEEVISPLETPYSSLDFAYEKSSPQTLNQIELTREERLLTTIGELDRVLGGGIVPGSVILIGGDPGIGKSTLLLQALNKLSVYGKVLYVSGEESIRQTKMRADRLGVSGLNLFVHAENSLEAIIKGIIELKPMAVVIDSIQ